MLDVCPVHHDAPRHTLSHPQSHNESCPVSGKPCIKLLLGTYISHRVRGKLLAVHTRGALQLQLRALSMHKGLVQLAVVPQQCGLQRGEGQGLCAAPFCQCDQ